MSIHVFILHPSFQVRRYGPFWALVSLKRHLHSSQSTAPLFQTPFPHSQIIFYLSVPSEALFEVFTTQSFFFYRVRLHVKSRRMRWAGHVARMGEERGCIGSWWGNRSEGNHWGDLGVDGWIILGWTSRRWDVCIWTGLGWPRIETGGGRL